MLISLILTVLTSSPAQAQYIPNISANVGNIITNTINQTTQQIATQQAQTALAVQQAQAAVAAQQAQAALAAQQAAQLQAQQEAHLAAQRQAQQVDAKRQVIGALPASTNATNTRASSAQNVRVRDSGRAAQFIGQQNGRSPSSTQNSTGVGFVASGTRSSRSTSPSGTHFVYSGGNSPSSNSNNWSSTPNYGSGTSPGAVK